MVETPADSDRDDRGGRTVVHREDTGSIDREYSFDSGGLVGLGIGAPGYGSHEGECELELRGAGNKPAPHAA